MAKQEHLEILKQGIKVWNHWRKEHTIIRAYLSDANLRGADLRGADLRGADLSRAILSRAILRGADLRGAILISANLDGADLRRDDFHPLSANFSAALTSANLSGAYLNGAFLSNANLSGANFSGAHLSNAILPSANLRGANLNGADLDGANLNGDDLSGANLCYAYLSGAHLIEANLRGANLSGADLRGADLRGANLTSAILTSAILTSAILSEANLRGANLREADLTNADLTSADLTRAMLIETNFAEATLTNCQIYGIAAWSVELKGAKQDNLVITRKGEPDITVDNLKVAQFIYLLLNNAEIRDVIDTISKKVVLILGRFTPERKTILDALKNELRKYNYSPVVFDFDRPENRDFTETARTLAHLSRFILADITEPSSIPQELQAIVPDLEVPVQPLLEEGKRQYAMFPDLRKHSWVFPVYLYKDQASLIASLKEAIIEPADKKARELAIEKAKRLEKL